VTFNWFDLLSSARSSFYGLGHGNQPVLIAFPKCVRWGTPQKSAPKLVHFGRQQQILLDLATQQQHQCIGWKLTHSLPKVRFKDLPAVPWLGLNDYLIGIFDLLGFLGFMISWAFIVIWGLGLFC